MKIKFDLQLFGSATLLGATSGPTINSMEAGVILSKKVIENIVMDAIEDNERGVTQSFATDTQGAQIKVLRVLPIVSKGRRFGATINGGTFNSNSAEVPASEIYYLDIIDTFDPNIDIPYQTQSMIDVNILQQKNIQIAQAVSKMTNAITIAGKIAKTFNEEPTLITYAAGSDDLQEKILTMNATLDDGDAEHGVQYFPKNDRCFVFRAAFRPELYKKGILSIGGANLAYQMIAKGAVSPDAVVRGEDGYAGDFDGVEVHFASTQVWSDAEDYLGLPIGELKDVYGYVSSAMSNARGIAHDNMIKIIDCPLGPGIRLQPCYRMGFESFYAKGNVFLVKNGFANPVTKIKVIDSDYKLKAIPAGSRAVPTVSWSNVTPTITLPTGLTATILKGVVTTKANRVAATANGVLTATTTGGVALKDITSGSAIGTPSGTGDFYGYVLIELSDGTVFVDESPVYTKA